MSEPGVYGFTVWQGGLQVAAVEGTDGVAVAREAMRYAWLYADEGAVTVRASSPMSFGALLNSNALVTLHAAEP